jgi:tetratricopeptide (TPR) repeat protein
MFRRTILGTAALLLGASAILQADDVYVKGKEKQPIKGKITKEGPQGVVVGLKDTVPAEDIVDVVYEIEPTSANIIYQQAVKLEKEGKTGEAIKRYEDALAGVKAPLAGKRQIEFKLIMLRIRQAQDDGEAPGKAIVEKLRDFAKKNAQGWQINSALQTLGRLQLDAGDFDGAEDTYTRISELDALSEDVKLDAKLLVVQVKLQAGKFDEARDRLAQLKADLPKGSRFAARAQVAEAECIVAEAKKLKDDAAKVKKFDQAIKLVRDVIQQSNDRYVKAVGHNTLGYCFMEQGQPKEAIWEFLWVDVVYNQDRMQHAKALYYLWLIFTKEGDAPKAQDCREALLQTQFNGLEYQRLVQKDVKAP